VKELVHQAQTGSKQCRYRGPASLLDQPRQQDWLREEAGEKLDRRL